VLSLDVMLIKRGPQEITFRVCRLGSCSRERVSSGRYFPTIAKTVCQRRPPGADLVPVGVRAPSISEMTLMGRTKA